MSLIKIFFSKSLMIALSLIKINHSISLLYKKSINEHRSITLSPNYERHTDRTLFISSVVVRKLIVNMMMLAKTLFNIQNKLSL